MTDTDPVDAHRALQKAARELAFYADHGYESVYLEAIDNLEKKLKIVRALGKRQNRSQSDRSL
jgi:hypothetical protein